MAEDIIHILDYTGDEVDEAIRKALLFDPDEVKHTNPNLLDNPWFTVNQRGLGTYVGSDSDAITYTIDRWYLDSWTPESTIGVNNGFINWTYEDAARYFGQRLDKTLIDYLTGKTVTLSVLFNNGNIVSKSVISPTEGNYAYDNDVFGSFGFYLQNTASYGMMRFRSNSQGSAQIKAVKLELGSISTLANDTAPDYATELLKCQRYYKVGWFDFAANNDLNEFQLVPTIDFVNMRTTPSVVIKSYNDEVGYISRWVNGEMVPTSVYVNPTTLQLHRRLVIHITGLITNMIYAGKYEASADL